jgi:hypothetical protein
MTEVYTTAFLSKVKAKLPEHVPIVVGRRLNRPDRGVQTTPLMINVFELETNAGVISLARL